MNASNEQSIQEKIAELQEAIQRGDPKVIGALANFLKKSPSEIENLSIETLNAAWQNGFTNVWENAFDNFSKKI